MQRVRPPGEAAFTGYQRAHKTRPGVRIAEIASKSIITIGGIGVIAAVFLVFVFLASVVVPLVGRSRLEPAVSQSGAGAAADAIDRFVLVDEFLVAAAELIDGGRALRHFRIDPGVPDGGMLLQELPLFDERPTSLTYSDEGGWLAAGFADGTIRLGQVLFETDFYEDDDVPARLHTLAEGEVGVLDDASIQRTPIGQLRRQRLEARIEDPVASGHTGAVLLIDQTVRSVGPVIAMVTDDGLLRVSAVTRRRNILTGRVTSSVRDGSAAIPDFDRDVPLSRVLVSGNADAVYVLWEDGAFVRFDTRDLRQPAVAERGDLLRDGAALTVGRFLLGRDTLLIGDSLGRVGTWFRVRDEDAATTDGLLLVGAHTFDGPATPGGPAAVTSIGSSSRKRMIVIGYDDGSVRSFYVTSNAFLAEARPFAGVPITAVALSPRDDAIAAVTERGFALLSMDSPHPEATLGSIFTRVWYEGNAEPEHVWQSSSATDTFEPKYGLVPLIFGTIKATIHSMLFGVPLAMLAAIYTSEFLHSRLRARIKPIIEMMASLPSVVLGFLAGLVFAPIAERAVPMILVAFLMIPLTCLAGGYLFQLLPDRTAIILSRYRILFVLLGALPLGLLLSRLAGPVAERALFAGDIKLWLDGQIGTGTGGWAILLLPLTGLATVWFLSRSLAPRLRVVYRRLPARQVALLEILKLVAAVAVAGGSALLGGYLLEALGLDSRGSFPVVGPVLGTYVQRNSLVVGFVMGFAIIPIIYTIADDALRSVPEHLRSASLAAGATPWQTAVRVIVPTAMSGLFSAVMIGLGRAVGETMIVLMAAGNTPILEMNLFNGFRTLAANIAVELPEAVVGSTHYRILFLTALTLFVMTFVVNTIAESVRQRFRRRAFEL